MEQWHLTEFYLHVSQRFLQLWLAMSYKDHPWNALIQHPTWQPELGGVWPEFIHKITFMNCQFHNLVHYAVQNPLLLYTLYIILQVTFIMYCKSLSYWMAEWSNWREYFIYYRFRSVAQFCRLNGHNCYPTGDKCVVHIQAVWRPVSKICEFVTAHFMAFKLEENIIKIRA